MRCLPHESFEFRKNVDFDIGRANCHVENCKGSLESAKIQREYYNSFRKNSKAVDPNSPGFFFFYYAQNVSYPSCPQQFGSSYSKANRKCRIFGIHDESTGIQANIQIDDEGNAGKGVNAVISMLDYYLNKIVADKVVLFADNCVRQNKNNAVVHYLLWRVMTGKNKSISLNFLLTGHTKFSPDRNFGILKSKHAKSTVDCLQDFIQVVNSCLPKSFNMAVPTRDPVTNVRNVTWAECDTFLKQSFKSIPSITKYHHFDSFRKFSRD